MKINPHEEPLAWACQELEAELRGLGDNVSAITAWGILKTRIEAYSQLLGVMDRMYSVLVEALEAGSDCDAQIIRFRTQVSRLKHENDRALEALGEAQPA